MTEKQKIEILEREVLSLKRKIKFIELAIFQFEERVIEKALTQYFRSHAVKVNVFEGQLERVIDQLAQMKKQKAKRKTSPRAQ